jgi:hypothetical protein
MLFKRFLKQVLKLPFSTVEGLLKVKRGRFFIKTAPGIIIKKDSNKMGNPL